MLVTILTVLAYVSAFLAILSVYQNRRLMHYICKPLTIVFIILIALQPKYPVPSLYRYMILAGLLLSLAGDTFLMLPGDYFIKGLVSFFVAHLFYIAAFTFASGHEVSTLSGLLFFGYGNYMLGVLWPHLGKLRWPVTAYVIVILTMGGIAMSWWIATQDWRSFLTMLGALFFIASDSLLALDKFKGRFRTAQFLILTTYFTAQWLIALST
jgi:uncharacterized membrane protein YhhN